MALSLRRDWLLSIPWYCIVFSRRFRDREQPTFLRSNTPSIVTHTLLTARLPKHRNETGGFMARSCNDPRACVLEYSGILPAKSSTFAVDGRFLTVQAYLSNDEWRLKLCTRFTINREPHSVLYENSFLETFGNRLSDEQRQSGFP